MTSYACLTDLLGILILSSGELQLSEIMIMSVLKCKLKKLRIRILAYVIVIVYTSEVT